MLLWLSKNSGVIVSSILRRANPRGSLHFITGRHSNGSFRYLGGVTISSPVLRTRSAASGEKYLNKAIHSFVGECTKLQNRSSLKSRVRILPVLRSTSQ